MALVGNSFSFISVHKPIVFLCEFGFVEALDYVWYSVPSHSVHCIRPVWTLVWLQLLQKWMHRCCLGCVQLPLRIFRRSQTERFFFVPLSFLDLMLGFLMNVAKVLVSLFISGAKTLIKSPSVNPATILCFSIAGKCLFIDILINLQ